MDRRSLAHPDRLEYGCIGLPHAGVDHHRARRCEDDTGARPVARSERIRHLLLVVTAAGASFVAIGFLAGEFKDLPFWPRTGHLTLSITALLLSWLLIQTLFAFHYARWYYSRERESVTHRGGLNFPGGKEPDYLDFAYYAFVVGMTSQVSDVCVMTRQMRRLTLVHGVLAFIFNIAILAMSINIIGGVI